MKKTILTTPIKNRDIESLNIGDIIYLSGYLVTGRDDVHHRLVGLNMELPLDLAGKAILHAGPIVTESGNEKTEDGTIAKESCIMNTDADKKYEVVSIGPTTSMRMEEYQKEFIKKTGVKLIIGKGGMGQRTAEGCMLYKAVHAVFPGGCAVLAAESVEKVEGVEWLELGMPEAVWIMRVRELGPLIVSIDTKGNNLFENNKKMFNSRKEAAIKEISSHG